MRRPLWFATFFVTGLAVGTLMASPRPGPVSPAGYPERVEVLPPLPPRGGAQPVERLRVTRVIDDGEPMDVTDGGGAPVWQVTLLCGGRRVTVHAVPER
jgi:hypothetical protein